MRMKGMRAVVPSTPKQSTVDPVTGLRLISKGGYDEALKPQTPKPPGPVTDLKSLLALCHYQKVKAWDDAAEISDRYMEAVQYGFSGSMAQWMANVLLGELQHQRADRTPSKIKSKLDDEITT